MGRPLRVIFMGTPDFAAVSLRALIGSEHDVVAVYSQPPRPKGRGHKVQKSPVHVLADEHDIKVYTPKSLKTPEAQEEFEALDADVAIVAAYGLLLPVAVLKATKSGCLNIHGSLLPRWRGASPIQRAIWAGDDKSGVTIMQMDKGLDTGGMILKKEIELTDDMTATMLHDCLADMGADMTLEVLQDLAENGAVSAEQQNGDLATYAHLLKKSDGLVDWSQSADEIDRQVRALNPWPGVWAEIQGKRFKIHSVNMLESGNINAQPGQVIDKNGAIACGKQSALRILMLQPEGKKPMEFSAALNGGYISIE